MTEEEKEKKIKTENKAENKTKKEERLTERKRKAQEDINNLMSEVNIEDESVKEATDDDDSEWEDEKERKTKKYKEYNTLSLPNFSHEAD